MFQVTHILYGIDFIIKYLVVIYLPPLLWMRLISCELVFLNLLFQFLGLSIETPVEKLRYFIYYALN